MIIGILGAHGSIGARHAANIQVLGHQWRGYDPARPDLYFSRQTVLDHSEAFVIASPTNQHWQDIWDTWVRERPILCEKPIIHPCRHTLEKLMDLGGNRGLRHTYVGFNLRFHPEVIRAKQWVATRKPWAANFIVAQHTDKPAYLRDGVVSNWASHEIDLALYLLGPATVKKAWGDDTQATIILNHDSGCVSTIYADYITQPEARGFSIDIDEPQEREEFILTGRSFDPDYVAEMATFITLAQAGGARSSTLATWQDGAAVVDIVIQAREKMGLNNDNVTDVA